MTTLPELFPKPSFLVEKSKAANAWFFVVVGVFTVAIVVALVGFDRFIIIIYAYVESRDVIMSEIYIHRWANGTLFCCELDGKTSANILKEPNTYFAMRWNIVQFTVLSDLVKLN